MKKTTAYLAALVKVMSSASVAFAADRASGEARLTDAQMRAIAIVAVHVTAPAALHLPGFELDREKTLNGYVTYEGVADTPGSVHVGFYVVDPRTGDVWDGVSACGEIKSAELQALKLKLRSHIGLSEHRYLQIRRRGPMCDQRTVPDAAARKVG